MHNPVIGSDTTYPRQDIARGLIFAIGRYSNLAKDAYSSLVNLGQAIHENASVADITSFIRGTVADEVYVRNACLQAMQVIAPLNQRTRTELLI